MTLSVKGKRDTTMVKISKSTLPPKLEKLLTKQSNPKHYRDGPVYDILLYDSHRKCYICEDDGQRLLPEHIKAHKGNKNLEYDWHNILPACWHCNEVKNSFKYDNILNCTTDDPEQYISTSISIADLRKNVIVSLREAIQKTQKAKDLYDKALETRNLIHSVYNNEKTAQRCDYSNKLRKKVLKEQNKLKQKLINFETENDPQLKNEYRIAIIGMISRNAPFAAIKRDFIKSRPEYKREFGKYL